MANPVGGFNGQPPVQQLQNRQEGRQPFPWLKAALGVLGAGAVYLAMKGGSTTTRFDPMIGPECQEHLEGVAAKQGFDLTRRDIVIEPSKYENIENPESLFVGCSQPSCFGNVTVPTHYCHLASETAHKYFQFFDASWDSLDPKDLLDARDFEMAAKLACLEDRFGSLPDALSLLDEDEIFPENSGKTWGSFFHCTATAAKHDPSLAKKIYNQVASSSESPDDALSCDELSASPLSKEQFGDPGLKRAAIGCLQTVLKNAICEAAPESNPYLCQPEKPKGMEGSWLRHRWENPAG